MYFLILCKCYVDRAKCPPLHSHVIIGKLSSFQLCGEVQGFNSSYMYAAHWVTRPKSRLRLRKLWFSIYSCTYTCVFVCMGCMYMCTCTCTLYVYCARALSSVWGHTHVCMWKCLLFQLLCAMLYNVSVMRGRLCAWEWLAAVGYLAPVFFSRFLLLHSYPKWLFFLFRLQRLWGACFILERSVTFAYSSLILNSRVRWHPFSLSLSLCLSVCMSVCLYVYLSKSISIKI